MDVLFLMSIFRLHPRLKMSFEHNSVRKNLFLSACFCWDSRLSLRQMNQKIKFGGTIGYGDSYLEFVFRHFKVFRLHAILQDAAGAVQVHGYIVVKDLVTATWLDEDQFQVCSVRWLDYSFAFT